MKAKLVFAANAHQRTFVIAFEKGEDPLPLLRAFAEKEGLHASGMTAIGGFARSVLGYFDRPRKEYVRIPVDEQAEVLSFLGDIATHEGRPIVHVQTVLGLSDATTRGGHLLEASVWPTLEVILNEWPAYLRKSYDPELGLPLLFGYASAVYSLVTASPAGEVPPTLLHDLHPARRE